MSLVFITRDQPVPAPLFRADLQQREVLLSTDKGVEISFSKLHCRNVHPVAVPEKYDRYVMLACDNGIAGIS